MTSSSSLSFLFFLLLSLHLASATYNQDDATIFAHSAALSYCSPDKIIDWDCGLHCRTLGGYQAYFSAEYKTTVQTLGFSMIYNKEARKFVIAFRGTSKLTQLLVETISLYSTPYTLYKIPGARVTEYFYDNYVSMFRDEFIRKFEQAVEEFPDYQFVFTGFSLGAAVATHAIFDVVSSGLIPGEQVVMYNFGSPRVGNYAFVEAVQKAVAGVYRVTHWRDMIPHLPLCKKDIFGNCEQGNFLDTLFSKIPISGVLVPTWPAWHLGPEIFYNKASTSYVVCEKGEDSNCSNQFYLGDTEDHYYYLGVPMSCFEN